MSGNWWFDSSVQRTLIEKLLRAIDYYRGRWGIAPAVIILPPMPLDELPIIPGIDISTHDGIKAHYFWIGDQPNGLNQFPGA